MAVALSIPVFDLRLLPGQAFDLRIEELDEEGQPLDLTGNVYVWNQFDSNDPARASVRSVSIAASGRYATLSMDGAGSEAICAATRGQQIGNELYQKITGGVRPLGLGVVKVAVRSAPTQTQGSGSAPTIIWQVRASSGTVMSTVAGPAGTPAWQSAGAESPAAYDAAVRQPALDAAGVATSAAGQVSEAIDAATTATTAAADAATLANQTTAAAQAVVDQQTATLGQVAQAKTDAQAARDVATGAAGAASQASAAAQAAMAYLNAQATLGPGTISGSIAPDITNASTLSATLTGNLSLGPPINPHGYTSFALALQQDASGHRTATFDPVYQPRPGLALSKTPGAIDLLSFTLAGAVWVVDINPFDSPFGSIAAKNIGVSIADRGNGAVEHVQPPQIIAGTAYDLTNGLYRVTARSNAGTAMSDTLPDGTALVNGALLLIENADASASDTLAAFSGQTINGAASVALASGLITTLRWDATNKNWRASGLTTLTNAGIQTYLPTLNFAGPGDLAVAYSSQTGWYQRVGNMIIGGFEIICVPTYTTASSSARVSIPVTPAPSAGNQTIALGEATTSTNTAWPSATGSLTGRIAGAAGYFTPYVSRSGGAPAAFATTSFPSGATVTIRGTFAYRIA